MADVASTRTADWALASGVLGTVSTLLDTIDWDALAAQVLRAETIGPILDPTAFAASMDTGTLYTNRAVVEATRDYVAKLRAVVQEGQAAND